MASRVTLAAAEAVDARAAAQRGQPRANPRRVVVCGCGAELGRHTLQLGPIRQGGLDENVLRRLQIDEIPDRQLRSRHPQIDGGVEGEAFGEAGGGDAAFDACPGGELVVALDAGAGAVGIALEGDSDLDGTHELARVILGDANGFVRDFDAGFGPRELEIARGRRGDARAADRLAGALGGTHALFGGEGVEECLAEVDLGHERGADVVGLLVGVDERADDVLNPTFVAAVSDGGLDPGEEAGARSLVGCAGLGGPGARDLDLVVLCPGEGEGGREIDRERRGGGVGRRGSRRLPSRLLTRRKLGRAHQARGGEAGEPLHRGASMWTASPSAIFAAPGISTVSPPERPAVTSTRFPSSNPVSTGRLRAIPFSLTKIERADFSTRIDSRGTVQTSAWRSTPIRAVMNMPGRRTRSGFA